MGKNSKVKTLTPDQVRALEHHAVNHFGMPLSLLMENAGAAVAREAGARLARRRTKNVAVVCGKGSNGGDGLVAARHLVAAGINPEVYLGCWNTEITGEAAENLRILQKMGCAIHEVTLDNMGLCRLLLRPYAVIVDALFGIGLKGDVEGLQSRLIEAINDSDAFVIAVDIPSGLDAVTGRVCGICVKAHMTVTFTAPKQGLVTGSGPRVCGRVVVASLGIPMSDL